MNRREEPATDHPESQCQWMPSVIYPGHDACLVEPVAHYREHATTTPPDLRHVPTSDLAGELERRGDLMVVPALPAPLDVERLARVMYDADPNFWGLGLGPKVEWDELTDQTRGQFVVDAADLLRPALHRAGPRRHRMTAPSPHPKWIRPESRQAAEANAQVLMSLAAAPSPDLRCNWKMESLIRYAVEVWGPESDVDSEADNGSMRADLETFLDVAAPSLLQERDRLDVDGLRPFLLHRITAALVDGLAEYARLSEQPSTEPGT